MGLGWISLPWTSLLGLACMDPACQMCAQNHFRFSPGVPASVCSRMSACPWATAAGWAAAEEPWEQQPRSGRRKCSVQLLQLLLGAGTAFSLPRDCPRLFDPPVQFTALLGDVPREFKGCLGGSRHYPGQQRKCLTPAYLQV